MINIEIDNQITTLQVFLSLGMLLFVIFLLVLSSLAVLIKLILGLTVAMVLFVHLLVRKPYTLSLSLIKSTQNKWAVVDKSDANNESIAYVKLVQSQYYVFFYYLYFENELSNKVSVTVWKEMVTTDQWRRLHVLHLLKSN